MLINFDEYNITIQIKENQNIKEFHVHSNILRICFPYFKNLFADKIKNEKIIFIFNEFNKLHITPTIFEIIFK